MDCAECPVALICLGGYAVINLCIRCTRVMLTHISSAEEQQQLEQRRLTRLIPYTMGEVVTGELFQCVAVRWRNSCPDCNPVWYETNGFAPLEKTP